MAWSTITALDIEAHLNAGELSDYRKHTAELADPLPTIIADVLSLARGYVGARYALEATGIPAALRLPVIDLIVHQLAKRIRKAADGDGDRAKAGDRALEMLKAVASGGLSLGEVASTPVGDRAGSWGSQTSFQSPPQD